MLEYGISLTGENESVKTCILAYFMQCVCWSFFHKVNFFVTLFFCCLFFFWKLGNFAQQLISRYSLCLLFQFISYFFPDHYTVIGFLFAACGFHIINLVLQIILCFKKSVNLHITLAIFQLLTCKYLCVIK